MVGEEVLRSWKIAFNPRYNCTEGPGRMTASVVGKLLLVAQGGEVTTS